MEATRMRLFAAVVMMLIAVFAVQNSAAQDSPASAPAPVPASGAAPFGPAVALASVLALAFGFVY